MATQHVHENGSLGTTSHPPETAIPPLGERADELLNALESGLGANGAADEEEESLQNYISDLMKRLGGNATATVPTKSPPSRQTPPPNATVPRPVGGEPTNELEGEPTRTAVRVERPPERAEFVAALRDVANNHARGMLSDHSRKTEYRRVRNGGIVATTASLGVLAVLAIYGADTTGAYLAAWGLNLVAAAWAVRFFIATGRPRPDREPFPEPFQAVEVRR